jgi:hypothetical protein
MLGATKVEHERSDRMLAAELQAVELASAQRFPQHVFRRCFTATQVPRRRDVVAIADLP